MTLLLCQISRRSELLLQALLVLAELYGVAAPGPVDNIAREIQCRQDFADPPYIVADFFGEEVRNYVRRVRKLLKELGIPCDLVNRHGRGYSLVFRDDK